MTTVEEVLGRPSQGLDRRAKRVAVHTFRPRRSWPAVLTGLVILVVAVVAAAEVIAALAGNPLRLIPVGAATDYAAATTWSEPSVQIASGVLALIGLALIVVALAPGQSRWTALRTDDPALVVGLTRPALRRAVAAAAQDVSGVDSVNVAVRGNKLRVHVRTGMRESRGLPAEVTAAVEHRLEELAPLRSMRIATHVRYAEG
ncbi:DUF6286 domain-containing protein [Nocardiopsis exhalans]|uniref:DUF6286 domain-containing protein n=2 Tax=Nocardiopsis TaxID=2013 RepID=A0A840WHP6_9ACTN|nr:MULTISPECIES: DUF6286 domain-containing protein [Nocardiopsis]MBB5495564.1 hypothetical protein [Nocardiopsis metallicus]QRN79146.1 MAG: alkaline shock response membrane anchor protein AmaP [Nocardiopsis sp. BM-2018]USY21600.1 DUF6286 domain-containing protein [Nocardiopsis exhalans]